MDVHLLARTKLISDSYWVLYWESASYIPLALEKNQAGSKQETRHRGDRHCDISIFGVFGFPSNLRVVCRLAMTFWANTFAVPASLSARESWAITFFCTPLLHFLCCQPRLKPARIWVFPPRRSLERRPIFPRQHRVLSSWGPYWLWHPRSTPSRG